MLNSPMIQNVSPAYVVRALVPQAHGTYVVRYQTLNDEIISSIHINNQSKTSSIESSDRDLHVVLSVRVDETLYKRPIMNYFLSLMGSRGEQNHAQLLEQYHSERSQLANYTSLTHELVLPIENLSWIIDPNEFRSLNFVRDRLSGKNNDGISEGYWQRPNQNDIKIFIKRFPQTSSYYDNELNLLQQLCFFSVVTLFGHYSDQQNNYLVFAHSGRSLESICPLRARTSLSKMSRIVNVAFQISNAMIYLEKKNIVHRDLTASNVLVDSYGYIRIADFGHAIQKEEGKNNLSKSITYNGEYRFQVRFLAPECIPKRVQSRSNQSNNQIRREIYASFSPKSDVWAFGILIVQLMLKNPSKPYPHIDNDRDVSKRVAMNREIHPKPDGCNIDIYYILQQCWAYEPINRISFQEIREKMRVLSSIFR
ncbi:unnamed protein product [Rotaria socialis]|uniref:Protein kinase domain-containing protein n=1 Tax=Rotaria socialis TaxID=392032 RepID=A0A820RK01_9BILA|nr:unnamed protein product [Rotaria socialis]CAF3686293.1 unnamed protein product [Rotaria socialis]CAF4440381.1 unnamed protein product [Rotaria socialis]CAF4506111.1 unnamed protein product [Rotaria socialis]